MYVSVASSHGPDRWRTLARAPKLALLVDLDGTLIEFKPTLEQATLDRETAQLLSRLVATGVQVVVVSGRPHESIDRRGEPGSGHLSRSGPLRRAP